MSAIRTGIAVGLLTFAGLGTVAAGPQEARGARSARLHIRVGSSLSTSGFPSALISDFGRWGFSDDSYTWLLFTYTTNHHPRISSATRLDIQAEYSITRKIALGLSVLSLAKATGQGYDYLGQAGELHLYDMGNSLDVSVRATAYLLGASYQPALSGRRRLSARAGLGLGIADIETTFETNRETEVFKGKPLCGLVHAGLDYRLFSHLTAGLTVRYRQVAFQTEEFEISSQYYDFDLGGTVVKPYRIAPSSYGLSGLEWGIGLGLHF